MDVAVKQGTTMLFVDWILLLLATCYVYIIDSFDLLEVLYLSSLLNLLARFRI